MGPDAMILVFWMLSFKPTFSLSFLTFIKRLFSSSLLHAIRVVSAYLRLLTFLPAILIPACASSSPVFLMMYSAYKLNKQGDNIQPWCTPFLIWKQSVVPCSVLTLVFWPAYRFLKMQVRWSGIPISFRIFQLVVIHTVKGFGIVSKAEVDVFLELFCFFDSSTDVGNLISDSSAFSKSSLTIWKFTVHTRLKPGLENFEHYLLYWHVRWVQLCGSLSILWHAYYPITCIYVYYIFMCITLFSSAQSCPTLCDPMNHSTPGLPVHHQLPEFTQTHAHRVGDAIQPSHPLSSPSLPAPNPSQHQGLFQWVSSSHEVPKYWNFNFSISPSNEHPGLIFFRMDWLVLLAVQGTLKSLLQHTHL